MVDYYIKLKEEEGDEAVSTSSQKVRESKQLYVEQFRTLPELLFNFTSFYALVGDTYDEAYQRVQFFKDVVENKGGHKIFYVKGKPVQREEDVHILYRMTWFSTPSDVSREVNDGRGPADFKISRGSKDKSLVEFKLAKNTHLKANLQKQTAIYEKASDAKRSIKVIVFFSTEEKKRAERILKELQMERNRDIVLVDARKTNKPSGSKA